MNIIIVGCGRVGRSIAEQLITESHSITIIDPNPEELERLSDTNDIMTIEGNGATYEVLSEAGVQGCDLLIAVTAADELNLYACLLAKNAGVKSTIARVRNPEYISDIAHVQDDLMLSLAINPEFACANEIARMVKFSGALKIDSFAKGTVDLTKIRITKDSPLVNKRVADCGAVLKSGVRICIAQRGEELFIPNGDSVIAEGDLISIVAKSEVMPKLLKNLGLISGKTRYVLILGGSKIAFYLAKVLKNAGVSVKIIEKDPARCEELVDNLDGVMVICGDAMDEDLLLSEGIEHASGVVCMMDTDEENVIASLYAKQVNPGAKVITELGNLKFSSIFDTLPLDTVIRPKQLTGEYIVRYVRGMQNTLGSNVETMYKINDGAAEALEFRVRGESAVTSVPLSELNLKNDLHVISINRGKKLIIPTGSDTIEPDDTVIVITKHKGLSDLKDILK